MPTRAAADDIAELIGGRFAPGSGAEASRLSHARGAAEGGGGARAEGPGPGQVWSDAARPEIAPGRRLRPPAPAVDAEAQLASNGPPGAGAAPAHRLRQRGADGTERSHPVPGSGGAPTFLGEYPLSRTSLRLRAALAASAEGSGQPGVPGLCRRSCPCPAALPSPESAVPAPRGASPVAGIKGQTR